MSTPEVSPLARALGSLPTGLYVVSSRSGERPLGFIGSFVMQQGIAPPVVSVAVGRDREHLKAIRESGRFALSILDEESSKVMSAFFKKYDGDQTPFDHVEHSDSPSGLPILTGALAWLECKLIGEHELDDHIVVFGTVEAGDKPREGSPSIHLRKNGLGY